MRGLYRIPALVIFWTKIQLSEKYSDVNIKILSYDAKIFLKIPVSNKLFEKAVLSIGALIMLKKLNLHFYYRIFLKHKKRRVLTFSKKKSS